MLVRHRYRSAVNYSRVLLISLRILACCSVGVKLFRDGLPRGKKQNGKFQLPPQLFVNKIIKRFLSPSSYIWPIQQHTLGTTSKESKGECSSFPAAKARYCRRKKYIIRRYIYFYYCYYYYCKSLLKSMFTTYKAAYTCVILCETDFGEKRSETLLKKNES